ncbi:hypothetical protein M2197_002372 [Bradyrhizobium japonicum]|nr:hypothetical protein [Bradyrhizobium japonicum]MCS3987978.1 hypothetical protein [Bradyrhizobium japonicum]MCS4017204.1 hypothetical protein [Bradyrhizobium japonicum]MCS4204300.1 hypothetical protein [Bradyrhizobium japonicum]BAL05789.1 hypothetical protein BJ6T_04910 [Bradyrhizobium japonicum USDA 6]
MPAPDVRVLLRAALLLPAESERDARQAELRREATSACAAARPGAAELAQAHAAEVPQPEAATAAWELPAVGAAAGAEVPDVPQAEEAVVVSGAMARQPAAAAREDAEVQPRAAAPSGAQELRAVLRQAEVARQDVRRAAVPSALPSEAASICRSLVVVSAPARPRAAARSAHAMRSLRIASRSEPSLQAARNEGWS